MGTDILYETLEFYGFPELLLGSWDSYPVKAAAWGTDFHIQLPTAFPGVVELEQQGVEIKLMHLLERASH